MRLITAQVGPLAAASATAISTSQTAPAAQALALQGGTGWSANNIATTQTAAGAQNLTLNGSLVSGGKAIIATASSVAITSVGNDTGINFTVTGISLGGAVVVEVVKGSNASVTSTKATFMTVSSVATSGATAGNVTVGTNASVYTQDKPRRVLITSGGNDSGINFKVTGTDWNGSPLTQTIVGGNVAAVATVNDFATVTQVLPSAATAGTVTVGTNGVGSSRPIFLDGYAHAPTALQIDVTGTVNYTVQQSLNDPNAGTVNWVSHPDATLVNATTTLEGNYAYLPTVCRVLLNSGTGSVVMSVRQASGTVL